MTRTNVVIGALLVLSTGIVYLPVRHAGFVSYDDDKEVEKNPHIQTGLTLEDVQWAFTSGERSNWLPLTRISHILDAQVFGMAPGWHHLVNVGIHCLAALALFGFLLSATGEQWPSAFVAFVFALHPLHVGSVAWVTERKDVLSALFWFLTLWAWVRYTREPTRWRYFPALILFAIGLMAKPMVVTLPFVLLLLDAWPLRRGFSKARIVEKIPFFVLSAISATVTFFVQRAGGALQALEHVPVSARLGNAMVAYITYLGQTLYPVRLAVFYAYPEHLPPWQILASGISLAGISLLAILCFRARRYVATGWFWYLGTLIPVIGIVQVGFQARADRYMYLPMVGLAIMAAWGGAEIVDRRPRLRPLAWGAAVVACLAMAVAANRETTYWKDSETLYRHAIAVTDRNYAMYFNLANTVGQNPKRALEAEELFRACLRIKPDYPDGHNNLGALLAKTPGRGDEAIAEFETAVRLNPAFASAHSNLGALLVKIPGHTQQALSEFETALRLDPDMSTAHAGVGGILATMPGRTREAAGHLERAVELNPDDGSSQDNLGVVLARLGEESEALDHFQQAVRINPNDPRAQLNLAVALSRRPERRMEAIEHFEASLRLRPDPALRESVDRFEKQ